MATLTTHEGAFFKPDFWGYFILAVAFICREKLVVSSLWKSTAPNLWEK